MFQGLVQWGAGQAVFLFTNRHALVSSHARPHWCMHVLTYARAPRYPRAHVHARARVHARMQTHGATHTRTPPRLSRL